MKLIRDDNCDYPQGVFAWYPFKCNACTLGNIFSDEKSARLLIGNALRDRVPPANIIVYIRSGSHHQNGLVLRTYTVDMT